MTADVPGGEARRAGLGIVMVARQSGRPILPVAIATSRYIAFNTWSRMTINLPYSGLGFAVGPVVHVPRDGRPRGARGLPAGGRGLPQCRHRSWPTSAPAPTQPAPRPDALLPGSTEPGLSPQGLPHADQLSRGRSRRCCSACASGAARRSRRGAASASAGRALPQARRAARLVPCRQRRRDQRHPAADGGAGAGSGPSLSFLLTTGTVTSAKLAAERLGPARRASVRAARRAGVRAQLPRPLAAGPGRVHRIGDLAEPDPGKLGARHPAGARQRPHDQALVPALAAQPGRRATAVQPLRAGAGAERNAGAPLQGARRAAARSRPAISRSTRRRRRSTWPSWSACGPRCTGRALLIAASTHDGEEPDHRRGAPRAAPHHPRPVHHHRAAPSRARRRPSPRCSRARGLERGAPLARRICPTATSDAYIADTIGELGMLYKLAPVAFIGGSLVDRGGQNPIEAVRQGAAVLTGPHWQNFSDAYNALISNRGAIVVRSAPETRRGRRPAAGRRDRARRHAQRAPTPRWPPSRARCRARSRRCCATCRPKTACARAS